MTDIHGIEDMMEHTKHLLQKEKARKKALVRIYKVLEKALEQRRDTELMAELMLEYEVYRQQQYYEYKLKHNRMSSKQRREYMDYISFFKQYVKLIRVKSSNLNCRF